MRPIAAAATLQTVPDDDTPLAQTTCVVEYIYLVNGSIDALSVVIHDGYDRQLVAVEMPAKSVAIYDVRRVRCVGGLWWQASGPGVTGYVLLQA